MRLVISEFVSLDGVAQAPGGPEEDTDGGFAHGGWSMPFFDPETMGAAVGQAMATTRALLFGRRTWQVMAAAWPARAGDPFADRMNEIDKYVVSGTLAQDDLSWRNTTLLAPAGLVGAVRRLRDSGDGDLQVMGSLTLARTLISNDLVDQYRLMIEPVMLGGGKRLFPEDGQARALELVAAATSKTGVQICTYRPARRLAAARGHPGPGARGEYDALVMSHRAVRLTGWGRVSPSWSELATPASAADAAALLRDEGARGVIARGLGRSYNNAAQCDGGVVASTARLNRIIELDTTAGRVTCQAGVSLEQLMVAGLPAGWFVPVSPGTRQVTVGGAIAADVHGKNHHVAGSFARHVESFDIVLPGGELRTVTPDSDPGLFWATAGGMGLTGFIVAATVRLKRVATSRLRVDTVRTADIDETMAVLAEHDRRYGYTVAWSDSLARGAGLGRSVITSGDFAGPADLPPDVRADPFAFRPGARLGMPPGCPPGLINRYSVALANAAWYRKAPRSRTGGLQTIGQFFHPLDGIRNWNRVYGPGGFRQYQYVVPFGAEAAVRRSLEMAAAARAPSFVTVLKRFGAGDPGLLSFPMPGWTLALDFPARAPGLARLLGSLDRLVIEAGGRVYLAKDSRVPAGALAQMYPRLPEFAKLRADLDPAGILASDLSRRLGL